MVDFAKMLKTKPVDIAPPPVLPVGTYQCRVGTYNTNAKQVNGEDRGIFSFKMTVVAVLGDVDEEALETFGGADKLKQHKLKHDVWVGEDDNLNAVKTFATDTCKVEVEENTTLEELLAGTQGATVLVSIQHKPRTDKQGKPTEGVFAVVNKVLPDEE